MANKRLDKNNGVTMEELENREKENDIIDLDVIQQAIKKLNEHTMNFINAIEGKKGRYDVEHIMIGNTMHLRAQDNMTKLFHCNKDDIEKKVELRIMQLKKIQQDKKI